MKKMSFVDFRESKKEVSVEEYKALLDSTLHLGVSPTSTILLYNETYMIEHLDDDTYSLLMNRTEYTAASLKELKLLELRLYNWMASECDYYEYLEFDERLSNAILNALPTFYCDLPYEIEFDEESKQYTLSKSDFTIEITADEKYVTVTVFITDNYTDVKEDREEDDKFSELKLSMYSDFEDFLIPFLLPYTG